jgi:hypothetical protein
MSAMSSPLEIIVGAVVVPLDLKKLTFLASAVV